MWGDGAVNTKDELPEKKMGATNIDKQRIRSKSGVL